jgi:Uma2 family endonuclease
MVDRRKKFEIYAKAGVREYWLVNPLARTIELLVLHEHRYDLIGNYQVGQTVRSEVSAGFKVKVEEVCPASR